MSKEKLASLEIKRIDSQRLTPVNKTPKYDVVEYWNYMNREEE